MEGSGAKKVPWANQKMTRTLQFSPWNGKIWGANCPLDRLTRQKSSPCLHGNPFGLCVSALTFRYFEGDMLTTISILTILLTLLLYTPVLLVYFSLYVLISELSQNYISQNKQFYLVVSRENNSERLQGARQTTGLLTMG